MEIDELKSAWNNMETPETTNEEIKRMLQENKHPVLKGIRRQAVAEVIGWSVFLAVYYSMFNGTEKPLWLNMLLIGSVLLPLMHNLMSYRFAKYLVKGDTIKQSVMNYLSNVKVYAVVSVAARAIFAASLLLFLTYGIKFTEAKYLSLIIVILVFLIQLGILSKLWQKRLLKISTIINSLNG